jgi:hypothetical protein
MSRSSGGGYYHHNTSFPRGLGKRGGFIGDIYGPKVFSAHTINRIYSKLRRFLS